MRTEDVNSNMRENFYLQSKRYNEEIPLGSSPGKRVFGSSIVGEWFCPKNGCNYSIYPYHLKKRQDDFRWVSGASTIKEGYVGPICPTCGTPLEYDEAE